MLELREVHTYYGHIHALKGISLRVDEGEVVALLGSNGAGKTTLLRTIQGLLRPQRGTILFQGAALERLPPDQVVRRGISQAPEGRLIFSRMTVLENLEMGAFSRRDGAAVKADLERVFSLFPRLRERQSQKGGTLSGGEQQMLAIGRALMARPKLLLLDEPSMGLAPLLVDQILDAVLGLKREGVTILLVEQNATAALSIADRGYVLEIGEITDSGTGAALLDDPKMRAAYLGV